MAFLLYFLLGTLLAVLVHRALRGYTAMPVAEVKKAGGWLAGIGAILAAALLPRMRPLLLLGAAFFPWLRSGRATMPGRRFHAVMSADEARQVLGVGKTATREEIEASYRRLMKNLHPDHGGSEYFATKLNEARDVLLGKPAR